MKLQFQSGEKPLWSQLYDRLEERIISGEYQVGEILPSEAIIMKEFEVSRITVRQAMDKLLNSGLIMRKRGIGTIVLKRDDKIKTAFQSYFNGIYEQNNVTDRKVISFKKVIPPIEASYFFNLKNQSEIYCLIREIWVDDSPVARFETYLSPDVPLSEHDDMNGSLYKKLQICNMEVTHVTEKITASLSTANDRKIFNLSKNDAIVHRVRKGYSMDKPIEYTYSKYVSKGYELTINLQ